MSEVESTTLENVFKCAFSVGRNHSTLVRKLLLDSAERSTLSVVNLVDATYVNIITKNLDPEVVKEILKAVFEVIATLLIANGRQVAAFLVKRLGEWLINNYFVEVLSALSRNGLVQAKL